MALLGAEKILPKFPGPPAKNTAPHIVVWHFDHSHFENLHRTGSDPLQCPTRKESRRKSNQFFRGLQSPATRRCESTPSAPPGPSLQPRSGQTIRETGWEGSDAHVGKQNARYFCRISRP